VCKNRVAKSSGVRNGASRFCARCQPMPRAVAHPTCFMSGTDNPMCVLSAGNGHTICIERRVDYRIKLGR
jgi:hypothetical protein